MSCPCLQSQGDDSSQADVRIEDIRIGKGEVEASISLRQSPLTTQSDGYRLLLRQVEAALQLSVPLYRHGPNGGACTYGAIRSAASAFRLFAMDEFEVHGECLASMRLRIRRSPGVGGVTGVEKLDLELCDEEGQVCVRLRGCAFEEEAREPAARLAQTGLDWLSVGESWRRHELVVAEGRWEEKVRETRDQRVLVVGATPADYASLAGLCREVGRAARVGEDLWRPCHLDPGPAGLAELQKLPRESALAVFLFLPGAASEEAAERELEWLLGWLRALLGRPGSERLRVYCCYRDERSVGSVYREALSGLLRSATLESVDQRYRGVCYEAVAESGLWRQLLVEWLWDESEGLPAQRVPLVRLGAEGRWELGAEELAECRPCEEAAVLREGGTYLLAGALGDVGEALCMALGRRYGAHLVLLSRRSPEAVSAALRRVESSGARVTYRQVDIGDLGQLRQVMQGLREDGMRLQGVIHLARRVMDGPLVRKRFEEFAAAMEAKVRGTLNLDAVTAEEPLEFFLGYSSMAAFGIKGSADYAYATAFQNAFSRYRHRLVGEGQRRGRSLALCWGAWERDGGVAREKLGERLDQLQRLGLALIVAESALQVMELSLGLEPAVSGYVAVTDRSAARRALGFAEPGGVRAQDVLERASAFGRGELSAEEFAEYLSGLEAGTLEGEAGAQVLAAIRRHERGRASRWAAPERSAVALAGVAVRRDPPLRREGPVKAKVAEPVRGPLARWNEEESATRVLAGLEKVLGLRRDAVDRDRTFQEYGLDSITAIQLTAALEKDFALPIPPSWLIEYPTVNALGPHLLKCGNTAVHPGGNTAEAIETI